MFRELSRKKQQLTESECIAILKDEKRGILSVIGDEGYPYGMPMNHFYDESNGKIYFHCGRFGHRTDAIKKNSRVSFCIIDGGHRKENDWAICFKSVIVFGEIRFINDENRVKEIAEKLSRKFTDDEEYIAEEILKFAKSTVILELSPKNICGKQVTES